MADFDSHNGSLAELVKLAKAKCRITWDDEVTEAAVRQIVLTAAPVVRFKLGIPDATDFDFTEPGPERSLLLAWCYYAWHDAADEFDRNYANDVAQARSIWEVRAYAEQQGEAS